MITFLFKGEQMHKFVVVMLFLVVVLAGYNASALQSMDSDNMKKVTAMAGVAIAIEDSTFEAWVGSTAYTDDDGTGDGDYGSIVITDKHYVQTFKSIKGSDKSSGELNSSMSAEAVIKIDVGNCPVLSSHEKNNGGAPSSITGVVYGLPMLETNTSSITSTISVTTQAGAINGGTYGQITTGAKTQHTLGGSVEIAAN